MNVLVLAANGIMRDAQKNAAGDDADAKKTKKKNKKASKPLSITVSSVIPYLVTCVRSISSPTPVSSPGAPATGAGGGVGAGAGAGAGDDGGLSFVAGRALSVLSAFSRAMPEDQCASVVAAAVEGLKVRAGARDAPGCVCSREAGNR